MELVIQHDKLTKKFFADINGQIAELDYALEEDSVLNYYRTFVPPELRGSQIGEKIVKFALDYARENNYKIIPSCPFVERIIARHPEYKILLRE
ncbi:MAG TPA: GNAT family N-acetyltransferase [Gammaproteobacteria bacterium]|nr:GNAT family N-acetyltransferase [Gammaproteobacteria bacterium]